MFKYVLRYYDNFKVSVCFSICQQFLAFQPFSAFGLAYPFMTKNGIKISLDCPFKGSVVKKVQRCMSLPFTKACSGQIYVVLWIKYYFIHEGAVQHNGFTFSNTCKKCWNIIYDFTIIIKSAFFSPGAIFLVPPPPPPFDGNLFYVVLTGRGKGGG